MKRSKIQSPIVDPMKLLHEHVTELMFQHFDAADVLIASEVNRKWFDTIGSSKKCMKLINLGLENWWQTETPKEMARVMKIVKKTTRKYQNVHVNCNDDLIVSKQAVNMLKSLAPSLVDLRFFNSDSGQVGPRYKFPKLECLQFINNTREIDELLLDASTQMRVLNMKHHYWADSKPVLQCLKNNKNLIMLKLWDTGIGKLFKIYDLNGFEFKLKRFATGSDGVVSPDAENNFLHFLESQSDCIEAIRFRSGLDGVSATIINKVFVMSAMKIIHLDGVGDLKQLDLKVNPRIKELRLPFCLDSLEKISPFLRAAPNVRILFIKSVNKEILEYIATRLKDLRVLYYTKADGCLGCFKRFLSANENSNKDISLVCREWF